MIGFDECNLICIDHTLKEKNYLAYQNKRAKITPNDNKFNEPIIKILP